MPEKIVPKGKASPGFPNGIEMFFVGGEQCFDAFQYLSISQVSKSIIQNEDAPDQHADALHHIRDGDGAKASQHIVQTADHTHYQHNDLDGRKITDAQRLVDMEDTIDGNGATIQYCRDEVDKNNPGERSQTRCAVFAHQIF